MTTPAIADFGAPPRPQIGSTQFAAAGRRLLAVYSRCQGASAIAGCDVYAYDLAAGTEQKIAKLASKTYSETAPSIELGRLAFVRRGGGPKPGVYYWALGSSSAPKRLTSTLARETATNSTRVAYTYNSSRGGGLAVRLLSGHGGVLVPVSRQPAVPRSPLLTRYNAAWLLQGGQMQATRRFAGSGGPFTLSVVERQPRAAGHDRQPRPQERPHERAVLPGRRGRQARRAGALLAVALADVGAQLRRGCGAR